MGRRILKRKSEMIIVSGSDVMYTALCLLKDDVVHPPYEAIILAKTLLKITQLISANGCKTELAEKVAKMDFIEFDSKFRELIAEKTACNDNSC